MKGTILTSSDSKAQYCSSQFLADRLSKVLASGSILSISFLWVGWGDDGGGDMKFNKSVPPRPNVSDFLKPNINRNSTVPLFGKLDRSSIFFESPHYSHSLASLAALKLPQPYST